MTLKRKVSLTFLFLSLFLSSVSGKEKNFPLEIDVIFSPCFCNEKIYIFSENGRNQTLKEKENAPKCNLFPLNPILQPICFKDKVFVVDKDGTFYFMSDDGVKPVGSFSEKIIGVHIFQEKLYIVSEKKITEFEGIDYNLNFNVISSFLTDKGIAIFGEREFIFFQGSKEMRSYPFSGKDIRGAVVLKDNFVTCQDNAICFLNKRGKIFRKYTVKSQIVSALYVDENKIAVASEDHFVRLFDRKGNVLWQFRIDGIPLQLEVTKNGILCASKNGSSLVLIDSKKGTEKWQYSIKDGEIRSFTVKNLKVFFYSLKENLESVLNIVEIPE